MAFSKDQLSQRKLDGYREWCKIVNWGRRNPAKFAEEFLGVEFMDYQRYVFMESWNKQFVLWLFTRNGGKALSLDTKIPTPNGIKTMLDIKIGDYVFDENGNPVKVINTSEIFLNHECYKITFEDGEVITADKDHLWEVSDSRSQQWNEEGTPFILTTGELYNKGYINSKGDEYFYSVPIAKPLQHEFQSSRKSIVKIEKTETVPTKCIMVDSERKLYQCGEKNTLTHNSTMTAPFIMTKMMLFPNFKSYILSVTTQQSNDTFMKMEDIAKRKIESFTGLTDIYLNEVVKSKGNDGFTHAPSGFKHELYNGSVCTALCGEENNIRGKRSNLNVYDESGFITENYAVTTEGFCLQDSNFKLGKETSANLLPENIPNQLLYCSSASGTDTYFYKLYREYSKEMILGSKNHFVADLDCEIVIGATNHGVVLDVPLLSRSKVESALRLNKEKARREYYNDFMAEGGTHQPIKRSAVLKSSYIRKPVLCNEDGKKHRYLFAYDPARQHDNSIVTVADLIEDEKVGLKARLVNCVSFADTLSKKKTPISTPNQTELLKQMIVDYNGVGFADHENLECLMIDSGSGGGGVGIGDYFMEGWTDKDGEFHRGLIDKEFYKDCADSYLDNMDKMLLVSPHKYKTAMFDATIEMINLGLIEFTAEYEGKGYLNVETVVNDEVVLEKKDLTFDEEMALTQLDLQKEEAYKMYRTDGTNGSHSYDLPKDRKNIDHDDRAYTLAMIGWYLSEQRRKNVIGKKKEEVDLSEYMLCF